MDDTISSQEKDMKIEGETKSSSILPSSVTNTLPNYHEFIRNEKSFLNKPKRFGERPDVIYKTILRSFKKYYLSEFNQLTDYKRKKRKSSTHEYLLQMSRTFVDTKLGETGYHDLHLFLAALVQPKLPSSLESNKKLLELSKVVGEVLYKFNKPKMADLLSYPQFCFLLKNFL